MTHELECRWQDGEAPFDGVTLHNSNYLNVVELSKILRCIVSVLKKHFSSTSLRFFDCWFEHDGILCVTDPSSWETLEGEVQSSESLEKAFTDWDHEVRRSYLTIDQIFLLRYYENVYTDRDEGSFDLTAPFDLITEICIELIQEGCQGFEIVPAIDYFLDRGFHASHMPYYQDELVLYRKGEMKNHPDYPSQMWRHPNQ